MESLSVGPAAGFGLTRWFDGQIVATQLQNRFPGQVLVTNPELRMSVATEADTLAPDSLNARVEQFLATQSLAPNGNWHYTWALTPPVITLPKYSYVADLAFASQRRRGKVELALSVKTQGNIARTYPLQVNILVEEPVRVAMRRINRGDILSADNTEVQLRETTHVAAETLPDRERVLGMRAKQGIPAGSLVSQNAVAWPPVVHRGSGATLVVRQGGIRITTEVVCRQDGVPGQIISARQPDTHRLLRARVMPNGELVPVLEGGS